MARAGSRPPAQKSAAPTTETDAASRTHAERRDEAERRLLAAAVKIVAERGTDGMTLAEVGEAAGYSRGLPGHYFGKKSDLVAAVASHIADGFANRLAQTSNREPGLDSLLHSVASYFDGSLQAPMGGRALQISLAEAMTEPLLEQPMSEVTQRSVRRLAVMLRKGVERGEIRKDVDCDAQAVAILGTLRGAVAMWATDPEQIDIAALRDGYLVSLKRNLAA